MNLRVTRCHQASSLNFVMPARICHMLSAIAFLTFTCQAGSSGPGASMVGEWGEYTDQHTSRW